jgi:hypothetical protein
MELTCDLPQDKSRVLRIATRIWWNAGGGSKKEFHMEGLTLVVLLLTFCATASLSFNSKAAVWIYITRPTNKINPLAFTSIAAVWIESPRPSNNSNAGR